jgi:FKBP-type peptidyl-prolyl cis-trans isomerase 2
VKDTGEIFDLTSEEVAKKEKLYDPKVRYGKVPVIVGERFVLKGLDDELLKMEVGDKKKVSLKPDDAFGQRDPKMIKVIPKSAFRKQDVEPVPGLIVNISGYKGRIQSSDSGRVRVDFNNPLAGKELEYDVEVCEKIEKPEEQIKSVFEFMGVADARVKINGSDAEVETDISMPPQVKERMTQLVKEHVSAGGKKIEKVKFTEVFGAESKAHEGEQSAPA